MVLLILQWNARSLIANGQEFKNFTSKQERCPDIICVQESWLKTCLNFPLQGYIVIRRDRTVGTGGGIVTFIKQGIGYRIVEINQEQEVLVVEIWEGSESIKIVNLYNPCKKLNIGDLVKIDEKGDQKMVWCGDFNSHNTLWGSEKRDQNGLVVEELLELRGLVCINDGSGTRIDIGSGKMSALDLTLVSDNLARKSTWNVMTQNNIGSDHFPILCKIGVEIQKEKVERIQRWAFNKANWEQFKERCEEYLEGIMGATEDVDELNTSICKAIRRAAVEAIGKNKSGNRKKVVPWWNEECREAVFIRNKALRNVRRSINFNDLINYKKAQAKVKREIRKAKRNYWRKFCESIGEEIEINEIWAMIRKMSGIQRVSSIPVYNV